MFPVISRGLLLAGLLVCAFYLPWWLVVLMSLWGVMATGSGELILVAVVLDGLSVAPNPQLITDFPITFLFLLVLLCRILLLPQLYHSYDTQT